MTFTASPYSDIWIPLTDCLVPSGCIRVSQTQKGEDNAITTDPTEGIHDKWERALSPQVSSHAVKWAPLPPGLAVLPWRPYLP